MRTEFVYGRGVSPLPVAKPEITLSCDDSLLPIDSFGKHKLKMPRGVLLSLALPERRINGYLLVSATFHGKSSSTGWKAIPAKLSVYGADTIQTAGPAQPVQ